MKPFATAAAAIAVALSAASALAGQDHVSAIRDLLDQGLRAEIANPAVVAAVHAQNARNATLDEAGVEALDAAWRVDVDAGGGEMVGRVLAGDVSKRLQAIQAGHRGLITEIFVMDAHGLNVGQSAPTSDYWQGDEAKFLKTYPKGPGAVFVDAVEFDESTQTLQSQVSFTLADPATGLPVGAVTVGVNVELLGL